MKTIFTISLMTISFFGMCQTNFYLKDGKKTSIAGEQTRLTFTNETTLERPEKVVIEGFAGTLIASLIPSIIDLGFKTSTDLLDKNLKKFTSEFSGRNTYMNKEKYISSFNIQRKIVVKGDIEEQKNAFSIEFVPLQVDENTIVFAIDKLSTLYSGAKSKNGYNYNDYIIEIKVSYYDGKEKKDQTSAPISLQLFKIGGENTEYTLRDSSSKHLYLSDKFPLNPDFKISEVSVKIVETNTAKVTAEKIKSIYDKYSDDTKDIAKNIINFYVEKSKDEKDESTETEDNK
jgi:hypothetical protein